MKNPIVITLGELKKIVWELEAKDLIYFKELGRGGDLGMGMFMGSKYCPNFWNRLAGYCYVRSKELELIRKANKALNKAQGAGPVAFFEIKPDVFGPLDF